MNDLKTPSITPLLFATSESLLVSIFARPLFPWELRELLIEKLSKELTATPFTYPFVYLKNQTQIYIGKNVQIDPGAMIEGPCYIGDNVRIGHNALIRAGTFLSSNVHIGHCSEISRSIFLEGAKAPHFNYVGDSVIGREVNLGAHATLANLRLDKKPIDINFQDKKIPTGKNKIGSFVGDFSSIGCGVLLNPGTIIQKGSMILPLTTHKGFV